MDWQAWSREAVALMQARNQAFLAEFALAGLPYRWDLDWAQIAFTGEGHATVADICLIGSVSAHAGTFLWAWANQAIPRAAQARLHEVRAFGETHALTLLLTAEWPASRAEGLEMLAVAGRVLDAQGVFVDADGDRTFFFTLHGFRTRPLSDVAWLQGAP
jgi:hypothetical protein